MPEMDGVEATRRLLSLSDAKVVITGLEDDGGRLAPPRALRARSKTRAVEDLMDVAAGGRR
jgi:CheY-like chemotaxis protein